MQARELPINVKSAEQRCVVRRKGVRVYVGPPQGGGIAIEAKNAALARTTEAALLVRLKNGWRGTLPDLVQEVRMVAEADAVAHEHVRQAERAVEAARLELELARGRLAGAQKALADAMRVERERRVI